jgi:signal transduction histidine kinase
MQQMISDLLSLSVISADKSFTKVNLRTLLEEVLVTFEHKLEETKAKLQADQLPDAFVVPAQFRQLFQNLISNALKFAKREVPPDIVIAHRYLSGEELTVYKVHQANRYLCIEISDNGIGFDNNYVDKIFAVFQRLHQRDAYEGTGIGLAICKKIVENHGGAIAATGIPGQGATFKIIIPEN